MIKTSLNELRVRIEKSEMKGIFFKFNIVFQIIFLIMISLMNIIMMINKKIFIKILNFIIIVKF